IGDGYDNAMIESFWSTMQVELLNRQTWRTRIELANAIFDYIEIYYNRPRRHSSIVLESQAPSEAQQTYEASPACTLTTTRTKTPDTSKSEQNPGRFTCDTSKSEQNPGRFSELQPCGSVFAETDWARQSRCTKEVSRRPTIGVWEQMFLSRTR